MTRGVRAPTIAIAVALALGMTMAPGTYVRPAAAAAASQVTNCASVLRADPAGSATALATIPEGAAVTTSGLVAGTAWSTRCGSQVSGSTWYAVTAVDGTPVSSLYGRSPVFAATGLFRDAGAPRYLEGIDVSRWQGTVDYGQVQRSGAAFVIAKATEGIGYEDPAWQTNRTATSAAGLRLGAYHFARPDLNPSNPTGEADWFVDRLNLVPGMLVPALDLEVAGSLGTAGLQAWVGQWLDRVYARTGTRPMIYTSPSFWKKYLGDTAAFADAGYEVLWVAHWFVSKPVTPGNNWSNRSWTFWQYDNCGSVPGISGCVDLDRFNGPDLTSVTAGATMRPVIAPAVGVKQGGTTTVPISIARTQFTLPVDLELSAMPPGVTATLGTPHVTGDATTLTLTATGGGTPIALGSWPITLTARSGGLTSTATTTLSITDGVAPTVTAPTYRLRSNLRVTDTSAALVASWTASDPSGVRAVAISRKVGSGAWTALTAPPPTAPSITGWQTFGVGSAYADRATDNAGNTSGWAYGQTATITAVQETGTGTSYAGSWASTANSYALGDRLRYTKTRGAAVTYTVTGNGVAWVAYRGPNRGKATVYVDGVAVATVNLYASTYQSKFVAYAANWASAGKHTIRIVALGTAGHPRVDVDAFLVLTVK